PRAPGGLPRPGAGARHVRRVGDRRDGNLDPLGSADRAPSLRKTLAATGTSRAPLAVMLKQAKKLTDSIACAAADAGKRGKHTTQDIADQIGPKRGLIGLAVIGAAVGASVLITRYLRRRSSEPRVGSAFDQDLEDEWRTPLTRGTEPRPPAGAY